MSNLVFYSSQDNECVVCFDAKVEVILSPCRHACLCKKCCSTLKSFSTSCPLCRTRFESVLNLNENQSPISKVSEEHMNEYLMTRENFIKKFNLRVRRDRNDLEIKASNVDNYRVDINVAKNVFVHYLGTSHYNPRGDSIKMESVGRKVNITTNSMKLMEEKGINLSDIMKPGLIVIFQE